MGTQSTWEFDFSQVDVKTIGQLSKM